MPIRTAMKYFLIGLFILFSTNILAQEKCALVIMKGHVRMDKNGTYLVVAEKTKAERKHLVKMETQDRFAPYLNHFVSGEFIISDKNILGVEKIDHTTFDPLMLNEAGSYKKLKDEKCPKP